MVGSDVIICDVEIVDQASELPAGTIIPMPLKLLRTAMDLPTEILRSSILNFTFLEHYLQCIPVVGVGTDAEFVIADMQAGPASPLQIMLNSSPLPDESDDALKGQLLL